MALSMYRGDSATIEAVMSEDGVAMTSLTGYSLKMYIATGYSTTPTITLTATISGGTGTFQMTKTQSKTLTNDQYFYEMKIVDATETEIATFESDILYVKNVIIEL